MQWYILVCMCLVMDNTADKLNELEGPYYDSSTVRALQELENRVQIL